MEHRLSSSCSDPLSEFAPPRELARLSSSSSAWQEANGLRCAPHCMPPQDRTSFHLRFLLACDQISRCASVHSTISATTTDVSSTFPPFPIGVSKNCPPLAS